MSWLFKPPQPDGCGPPSSPIAKQLRAAANFLAPPPQSGDAEPPSPSSQALIGIRNDLTELKDSLRSGFSKFTSSIWRSGEESDDVAVGLNEEVVDFVKQLLMRPLYWTDFPLPLDDDFKMSDAQRAHAYTIERMVPSFKELRANLHDQISDSQFWMAYFLLLLPRLNEHDFEILSTPRIVEKRNALLEKLRNKRDANAECSAVSDTPESSHDGSKVNEKCDKNKSHEENDVTEIVKAAKTSEIEEEAISFSEYENENNNQSSRISTSSQKQSTRALTPCSSTDWVQLHDSYGPLKARKSASPDSDAESTDWFKVSDSD